MRAMSPREFKVFLKKMSDPKKGGVSIQVIKNPMETIDQDEDLRKLK